MKTRPLLLACAAAAALFAASAAEAAQVSWSIGIHLPPVASFVTSGPVWAPAPIAYAPSPVVYSTPAPVYAPAPIVYAQPSFGAVVVPRVGFHGPVVVAPRHRVWAPPVRWVPSPRGWDRHDHVRHDVDDRH